MNDADKIKQLISDCIESTSQLDGPLLPTLHKIQDNLGYIPKESIPIIASAQKRSKAEIKGVISFYHHFKTTAPARVEITICRAEACQSVGSRQLEQQISQDIEQSQLQGKYVDTNISPVFCLGNCACGPNIVVNGQMHGKVSAEKFRTIYQNEIASLVENSK